MSQPSERDEQTTERNTCKTHSRQVIYSFDTVEKTHTGRDRLPITIRLEKEKGLENLNEPNDNIDAAIGGRRDRISRHGAIE